MGSSMKTGTGGMFEVLFVFQEAANRDGSCSWVWVGRWVDDDEGTCKV
jgi:hypothetical protein